MSTADGQGEGGGGGVKMEEKKDRATNMFTLVLSKTEKAKKNTQTMYLFMLSYFAVAIIAYYLNLGESELLIGLANYMASIIPSINGTAAISEHYNYARVVLVISWCFIVPFYVSRVKNADWDNIKKENINFMIIAVALFLFGFLWAAIYKIPNTSGQYDRLIFNIIKSFTFGISIWGFLIWFLTSLLLSSLTIMVVLRTRMMFGRY